MIWFLSCFTRKKKIAVDFYDNVESCCIICFEPLFKIEEDKITEPLNKNYVKLSGCGHEFHRSCIIDWYSKKIQCPLCGN